MLLYNARKYNSGFTLIEMLATIVIIGVIAAIASPTFIGLLSRYRLNGALQQLLGAINESQRLAMLQGKSCRIEISPSTKNITANQ